MTKWYGLFLGFLFMFISCASGVKINTKHVHIDMVKCDDWVKLINENKVGELIIKNETPVKLYYDKWLQPFIEVQLLNEGIENTFYFMVDTGAQGSIITRSALKKMGDPNKSDYLFMNEYQYAPSLKGASYGYYFERLETENFFVEDILLQEMPVDELYNSLDGYPIDGILGMSVLSQKIFMINNEKEEFCFLDKIQDIENYKTIKFSKNKYNQYRLNTKMKINKIKLKTDLDTGAYVTYINGNALKKVLAKNDFIVDEVNKYGYQRHCVLDNIIFADQKFSNIHVQSSKPSIFDKSNTIGNEILLNYNLVVDYKNGIGFFTHNTREIKHLKANYLINPNGPVIGFSLNITKYPIEVIGVQVVNGGQVVPEISPGDKLNTINGIPANKFDWNNWKYINDAEIEFWNETQMYTVHCKRQYLFPDDM